MFRATWGSQSPTGGLLPGAGPGGIQVARSLQVRTVRGREAGEDGAPSSCPYCKLQ